jgi:hypothetical protein
LLVCLQSVLRYSVKSIVRDEKIVSWTHCLLYSRYE